MRNVYVVERKRFDSVENKYVEFYPTMEIFSSEAKAKEMVYYSIENEELMLTRQDNTSRDIVIDAKYYNDTKYRFVITKMIVNQYDYSV
jgi:hypothetical protein